MRVIEMICRLLQLLGIPWYLREIRHRYHPVIVNYHDPAPEIFHAHMVCFSRLYNFISIDFLQQVLQSQQWHRLPSKPMVVTLDDGCTGNERLFDIMKSMNIPVTIYAVAGSVGTGRRFWFNCIPRHSDDMLKLKSISNKERKTILFNRYDFSDDREYDCGDGLSIESLQEFINKGGIVGSHTQTHPILTRCDAKEQLSEITESRDWLEKLTGSSVVHFAYPNGDWDAVTRNLVQQAGYLTARTTDPGYVHPKTDLWTLPDMGISDTASTIKAVIQASGLWYLLKHLADGVRQLKG